MCVAILLKPGAKIPIENLREGARVNKDGSGYAFRQPNGKIKIVKGLKWEGHVETSFVRDHKQYGEKSAFLVHHRIMSHGPITFENCHPFLMKDGGAFIHNGYIPLAELHEGYSDTRTFVVDVLDHLPKDWQTDKNWCSMVDKMIGASKAVGLWPDGSYHIFNEQQGSWFDDDMKFVMDKDADKEGKSWHSNRSCTISTYQQPPKAPVTTTGGRSTHTGMGGSRQNTFELPMDQFEKIGEHSWRVRTDAPAQTPLLLPGADLPVVHGEGEIERALLKMFSSWEEDDNDWEGRNLRRGVCPDCLATVATEKDARIHFYSTCWKRREV